EGPKGRTGRFPEPRQELGEDIERGLGTSRGEGRARQAALDEQRVVLRVVRQQPHGALAVPELERRRLVLRLAMRLLDLENRILAGLGYRGLYEDGGSSRFEGLAEG